ncbi:MAG: hypothetical protein OXE96_14910 [Gemmatimonadetes bacterium]|nr:hypothetical protein [Gemmatimonadota bacterium]
MSEPGRMSRYGAFLVAGVATLAACESTTDPADPLTPEETEALYFGLTELAQDTAPEFISTTPAGAVVACPSGGQVTAAIEAREDMAGDTTRLITHTTLDPDGCVFSSEGYEFTVDGNPDVVIALSIGFAVVGETFEFLVDGSMTGGLDWQLEDRSGTCMIDLTLGLDLSSLQPAGLVSGTMCGLEVEFTQSINVAM